MSNQKPHKQDEYYAHGNSMKDFLRSLFIANARPTQGRVAVRDGLDVKRTMHMVMICLLPAILFGMYNIGYQAQIAIAAGAAAPDAWQLVPFNALFGEITTQSSGSSLFLYGASFYFPIYITALSVNLFWEVIFARVRKQQLHEGFFVTALLFTLILPVNTPLWMVAMGISFGVVMGKEVFGGMGCNFLNPALTSLAFIYFAYPKVFAAKEQLVAVDGFSGATQLTQIAAKKLSFNDYSWFDAFTDPRWLDAFLGFQPGGIGETSTLALLIGGGLLLLTRLANWRIVVGVLAGMILTASMFNLIGSSKNAMFALPWTWHLVTGGFAIGMMFMATDPITAAYSNKGKFAYGVLIGLMCVLIRVVNPKMPEGMMLAILFANLWAPIFDYIVVQANIKRRIARNGL
ncbi:NADH:ubiquinone reductase (Na(+)-transporting) subunit B [Ferrimonas lipolytica]|uniref:Na(+)-translocating NADH-quinone reductase subunit B n=1 Tax=Ferrimonas lipolytica TaxID=2724191 RepID=A0A6H1UCZ4_9GAMM|nr:NADH:ubiquinone reductase (Na(+)-transporting) subunit B [Ferrimonas lipolytica]QIZ76076.1 NADH:ubiquinone reductase (Na(+)-transporting) subunit B [Ferrimonas lipolytica]